ncbi:MAG: hypothetical protein ACO3S5_13070, partial [Ilumatobacteraceae bacterium]
MSGGPIDAEIRSRVARAVEIADGLGFGPQAATLLDRIESIDAKAAAGKPLSAALKSANTAWRALQTKAHAAYQKEWRASWGYVAKEERSLPTDWVPRGGTLYTTTES